MASGFDRWLATASRNTLAFLIIGLGIILIIVFNPPHTICDSQVAQIRELQKGFVFRDKTDREAMKKASFVEMSNYCKLGNTPGACYELFAKLRDLVRDLTTVPQDCASTVGAINEIQLVLQESADLMARIAWTEKMPESHVDKFGWLDPADMSLFCALKEQYIRLLGQAVWDNYRERLFRELPGAKDLPRKMAWERMILSENCSRYP